MLQSDEASVSELVSKLVLFYNAKASKGSICQDLSPRHNDARVTAAKSTTWDIKDVINSLGGIQVLFPLLELVAKLPPPTGSDVTSELMNSTSSTSMTSQRHPGHVTPQSSMDSVSNDWDIVPSRQVTGNFLRLKIETVMVKIVIIIKV